MGSESLIVWEVVKLPLVSSSLFMLWGQIFHALTAVYFLSDRGGLLVLIHLKQSILATIVNSNPRCPLTMVLARTGSLNSRLIP